MIEARLAALNRTIDETQLGAEEVRSAGHTMVRAAETMNSAASTIDGALERQRHFLEDWLARFEIAVEKMPRKCEPDPNEKIEVSPAAVWKPCSSCPAPIDCASWCSCERGLL